MCARQFQRSQIQLGWAHEIILQAPIVVENFNVNALEWIFDGNGERFIPHRIQVPMNGFRFVQ